MDMDMKAKLLSSGFAFWPGDHQPLFDWAPQKFWSLEWFLKAEAYSLLCSSSPVEAVLLS